MIKNTMEKITNIITEAETFLLYPHIMMDGDTLGSSIALCRALRKMGKKAFILLEDEIPSYLQFLEKDYCTFDQNEIEVPDVCMSIDCSDIDRFHKRREKYLFGKVTICIDHHKTNNLFAEISYIDKHAAATGEIIYELIKSLGVSMDVEMAEALYTAITTDTGNFQYTNTTRKTHMIVAELFETGIDLEKISLEVYQNIRLEKLKITTMILETIEMLCDGKADIAYVSQEMLSKTGAKLDETDGVIETLRNISGVEISVFLKEIKPNEIKVGLRSKTYADVSKIAQKYNGGGHRKAAGCTLKGTLMEVKQQISLDVINQLSIEN